MSWPGQIPAGVVHDDLVSLSDLPATLLDYAGADPVPEQRGVSLRDRVAGGPPLERDEVIGLHPGLGSFLVTDTWRYLRFQSDGHEELYRIDVDPFETVDLAATEPALVAGFRSQVDAWIVAQGQPAPVVEVVGRLAEPGGTPLAGSRLRIAGSSLNAIAGTDGFFRIGPLPASSYALMRQSTISGTNALGRAGVIPISGDLLARGVHIPVTAQGPAPRRSYDARIDGVLETETGTPLPGHVVQVRGRLQGGGSIRLQSVTGPDGRYRAENLAPGTYRLSASVPSGYRPPRVSDVEVAAETRQTVDLVATAD